MKLLFFSLTIFIWTRKVNLELCLHSVFRYKAGQLPFLLCGSSHQPHYISQSWLPGRHSWIVVVSCCDVAHCRNGHGLACTGCHPPARKASRGSGLGPGPGDQISTGSPSITHHNAGESCFVRRK